MVNEPLAVEIVEDPVCVIFQASCEYNYLEVAGHLCQEGVSKWTRSVVTTAVVEVNEGFVKIENKGIIPVSPYWRKQ